MNKIFWLLIILALAVLVYFGYPIVINRYFETDSRIILNTFSDDENKEVVASLEKTGDSEIKEEEKDESVSVKVEPADCDNQCSRFKKSTEKEYCQQYCGLVSYFEESTDEAEGENIETADCADEKGLHKDYCLKDVSVEKNDLKICDEINDEGIKKSCQNRIIEDILEEQDPLTQ